jgi:rhomboid family GlyGly-CTERM serine protease
VHGAARRLERAPASTVVALACVALALLPEAVASHLAYDRGAILSGQLWRLWSGHFVHFSMQHALADALVLFSMGALAEPVAGTRRLALALALGAPLISLGLLAVAPALVEYRGASGLAVMLAVAAGGLLWHASARWKAAIAVIAIAFAAKTLCEASGLSFDATTLPDGVAVAWQAHVLGALLGALLPVGCALVRTRAPA